MLRISKKADYALAFLGHIAKAGAYPGGSNPDRVISAQALADLTGLHKSVVANLLKDLTRDGVLTSVRGLRGGYKLAVVPSELSFHRVLRVVDGPFQLVECCDNAHTPIETPAGEGCSLVQVCPSRSPMQIVNMRFENMLEELRLDELCGLTLPRQPQRTYRTTAPEANGNHSSGNGTTQPANDTASTNGHSADRQPTNGQQAPRQHTS